VNYYRGEIRKTGENENVGQNIISVVFFHVSCRWTLLVRTVSKTFG
jgi:hypothetical protein